MRRKERRRDEISRKAWQAATNALLWYEDNKREYAELTEEILSGSGSRDTAETHPDPTGMTAVQIYESVRLQRIRAEVEAVEQVVRQLQPEELRVIRARYWTGQRGTKRKPRQYDFLQDLGYSTRSMIRISKATVLRVAALLGER